MNAFKEVKDWLLLKFQTLSTRQEDSVITRGINALTPRTIPEFVIPGSGNSSRRTSSECFGDMTLDFERKRNSYGGRQSSPPLSPRLSPSESMPCFHNAGRLSCSSAPVTPKHEVRNSIACKRGSSSTPGLNRMAHEDTNYDPLSIAAMSLPHFRGQTSFGFSTLTENPHTRRKESLFHAGSESLLTKRTNGKTIRQIKQFSKENISQDAHRLMAYHTKTNTQSPSVSMPSVIVTAAKQSTQTSPTDINMFPSQSSRRLSPTYHIYSNDGLSIANFNRFYNRRRSSLQIMTENEQEEFANASEASTPSNDQQQRHSLGELHAQIVKASLKRHSAPNIPSEQKGRMEEIPKPRSSSCHVIRNDSYSQITQSTHLFAPHGELKFSFQYLPASKQLKVTIIKAENLGGQLKQDRQFNCFAKTYLMPGKLQKQISTIIKRTRDPMFDQEFYFQNITTEELHGMSLVIKLFSKATNFKPNEFIGKVSIPLDNYDVMNENRIWKDLELSKEREDSGFLHVGLKYDRCNGNVTVVIDQAKCLPNHPITGPPNAYVCIEVSAPNKQMMKQQTNIIKSELNPVFQETFVFNITNQTEYLQNTSVNISVFDHDRIRSDLLIGQVVLGCLATEVSQYGHWQEMLENAGFMISKWHYLIDRNE